MSASSSNVTSPSTSSRPSTSFGSSLPKSSSNYSLFGRSDKLTRSRQNTLGGHEFADDLVRNIGSDYQEIQIRTLTKWVNAQLKVVGESIKDIKIDLRDGKKLLKLLSVISKEPAPKPERMNMRIHQLSNVAQALGFLERQVGLDSMPDIGNEAIVNGDAKKTLALIFFIMLKYQIQLIVSEHGDDFLHSLAELSERENGVKTQTDFNIETPSKPAPLSSARKFNSHNSIAEKLQHTSTSAEAKVALLYWVRIQLEDYISANIIPSIQDFSRSWRNGVAFCLLIHRYNPTFIPDLFSVYLNNPDLTEKATWHRLLSLSFGIATEHMGVQPYLEPEDLVDVDYPHEPSVMMYVSEYYKVMSKYQAEEPVNIKRERAVKRKAEIILASGGNIDLIEDDEDDEGRYTSSPPPTDELVSSCTSEADKSVPAKQQPQNLQPPTPIPMPSARRKIKMAQRESTLGKEDKARIKADLNTKLLMQLTGHLPRGVHPILDELLTIHETVLSFIKSNTRTIDEIPEEFSSSSSVTEYIDALEIIEEQVDNEVGHLDTAKNAKDVLTSPPETADDTLIRLTDLQRTQVSKLYDMLKKEWDQFVELLKTTKDDLLSVESALIDTEEGAEEYQYRANAMEKQLDSFIKLLSQVAPMTKNKKKKLHPIEGDSKDAEQYKSKLLAFSEQFKSFQTSAWKEFRKSSRHLSRAVMQVVSIRSNEVISKYDTLVIDLEHERQASVNFERGLIFLTKIDEIDAELTLIQQTMEDSGEQETTNDDIQLLESKVADVRNIIHNVKEEYGDLVESDTQFKNLFSKIQSRYENVSAWVDQVRVWFIEADRIRDWIEARIKIIHDSNEQIEIDPFIVDMSHWEKSTTYKICDEHKKLKREIERFDQDDMTRLRAHVKSLTHASERNISPADASTIEITLTTLNVLNRLMKALETRTRLVDTLQLRIQWEDLLAKAITWLEAKDQEINTFVNGKARWNEPIEDEVSHHYLKELTEEVIQSLVSLENSIAEFDKGKFSEVLDSYQEMEELVDAALPIHMEERQEEFEKRFELLMKRCSFVRKVVEQHLVINEVTSQFRKLRTEGEKLKSSMTHSTDTSSNTQSDQSFDQRVQAFKDNSSNWVTTLVKRIPYPETSDKLSDNDIASNAMSNTLIQDRMNEYATYLAEITEELEQLLSSHRETLSLQQRASLAYDDILHLTSWLEDRVRAIQKFDAATILEIEDAIVLEDETLVRLEKEQDGIAVRLEQLENRDMAKALDTVRRLEVEIDEINSVSIDRNTLISGIERLEQSQKELKKALVTRTHELVALKERIRWESQWEDAYQAMNDLAHQLWDFNDRFAQYDTEGLKKKRISLSDPESETGSKDEVKKEPLFAKLASLVSDISSQFDILDFDDTYHALENAYHAYYQDEEKKEDVSSPPQHIVAKQADLKEKYQDLNSLLKYVSQVMDQHNEIAELVKLSDKVQAEGEAAQNSIQNIIRESTSTTTSSTTTNEAAVAAAGTKEPIISDEEIERLVSIQNQIVQLCETGKSIQYLEGGHWFESSQPQSLVPFNEYNNQIKAFIRKKMDHLNKLKDSMTRILNNYQYTDAIKSKLEEYQMEANQIQEWIDKASDGLNKRHIDVAVSSASKISQDTITLYKTENMQLVTELQEFESTRVESLQENLDNLVKEVTEKASSIIVETTESCKFLSEQMHRSLLLLRQGIFNQSLVLDTAEKRLEWEKNLEEATSRLDFMNHQLQLYILKKNKCVAQQDTISVTLIETLVEERDDIEQQCQRFKSDTMQPLETQYEQVKALFIKLPLTKSIPVDIQERMELLSRNLKKLQDALVWRSKELDYIKQRGELELDMKQSMIDLDQYRKSIGLFVESKARWSPDDIHQLQHDVINQEAETQWTDEKSRFEAYTEHTLLCIKDKYQTLQAISNSLKPGFMSELHIKKIEALTQIEDYVNADIAYARQVVTQRKQISEFLDNTSELEKLAESIKETFLSFSVTEKQDKMTEYNQRLEEFMSRVEETKQVAMTGMIVPKRTNEEDIAMPTKVKDKTMNSVAQDVISTRIGRLDELVESLSALFKSQEVFTRLQYILNIFKRQITACDHWISSRREILEKSVHVLDDDNLALDIDHLRDAVSEADSIQTAMKAHDNHFTLLCKHREQYITIFDEQGLLSEEEKQEQMNEFDQVSASFESISREWEDLLLETKEVSNALSIALLPAELNGRIANLMASFESLQQEIRAEDEGSVTDYQISLWQKRIDHLEYKEYDRLHSEIADYKHTINADMIESLMTKLDQAGDTVLEIRATLTGLYDLINASRLRNTHAENSELFQNAAKKLIEAIHDVGVKFSLTTDKTTAEERAQHFKELASVHKQIKETILECQGFYDDSCSYYSGIKVQDVNTAETLEVQENVERVWNQIESENSSLSAFVTRTSKWIEGCDELDKLKRALESLKVDVDKIAGIQLHPTSNHKIHKYEKQLLQITMNLEELENTIKTTADMDQDVMNKSKFLSHSQEVRNLGLVIQRILDKRRMDKERSSLFETFKSEIAKVSKTCEDQISYIRQQSAANPENHLKKADTINSIINAYSAALSHIQDTYSECKTKYEGVISDHATKLIKTFDHTPYEINNAKLGVDKLLKELDGVLKVENDYITSLKLLGRLIKFDKEISRNITDLKSGAGGTRSYTTKSSRTSRTTRDLPELRDYMQRFDSIESSIREFQQKCDEIKKNLNKRISIARTSAITKTVDRRKEEMSRKCMEIKTSADETRERLDTIHKRQTASSKLNESLKYVGNLKDRVEVLQLSGQSVSIEEQELNELQEEIDVTLKKYTQDIDALLKALSHSDIINTTSLSEGSLKAQREKLGKSIEELRQLVKHRMKQAHTEGSITEFFGITDQVDADILMLSKVIEETSTQHASVVGSKFNKADLQRLLKTLTAAYKKTEPKIAQLLVKAKLEAQKQFLDDNDRVATRMKKTMKDWSSVQTSVSSREKELQTCIKELNHEFFTKLAMAKSSPRERRGRRSSKSRLDTAATTPPPSSRQFSFRSSTLSTEMKMNNTQNVRRSKTPNGSTNTGGRHGNNSTYIADPKNELDVQLGLIVNESPFRMKVKMVPGEAGKYWFGDEHPRLVYCRILPSKMVMVRVGGGWVELSKFMKDHGHSDNLATKSEAGETRYLTVNTFNDVDETPSFSITTRSGSPMGPVVGTPIIRRGSGVSSSLTNRSSNSSSGYVEGDKFIQTNEEGNQVALKMVKADSNTLKPNSTSTKKRNGI
ncbi:hypothetical protein BD770DRAFT_363603 [Pilaira anomala]|nr:hypothetical protein BD770DRAFT_363603 [Pilaira anomala]